ncbi:NAC-domain protein [Striga asiatica]|uniref:NAC-domain protein n=1 Tax=Striga asiatica TaxID=4170 RepID=A0A5A7RH52_STRAF|nr:NAC-domain protein [Striga asiatica]
MSYGVETKDYSHDSSSSCSSQYDDVLEALPEIKNSYFPLPRLNSFRNLQQLGSGDFEWATLAGIGPEQDGPQQQQGSLIKNMGSQNGVCAAVGGPENQNPAAFVQNYYYSTSADPFGARYPAQPGGAMGLWQ